MIPVQVTARLAIFSVATSCLLVVLSLVLTPMTAHASWCRAHEDKLQNAEVIFSGTVLKITRDKGDDIVMLDVSQTWKGSVQSQAVVHSKEIRDCGVGNCGFKFKVGNSYLVFAYQWPAQTDLDMGGSTTIPPGVPTILATDICSRTSLLSVAKQDLLDLGPGRLPSAGSSDLEHISALLFYLLAAFAGIFIGAGLRRLGTRGI